MNIDNDYENFGSAISLLSIVFGRSSPVGVRRVPSAHSGQGQLAGLMALKCGVTCCSDVDKRVTAGCLAVPADARIGGIETLSMKRTMEVSLARSLRSLLAAAALLMAAYAIAASPSLHSGDFPPARLPSLGVSLMEVPQALGFSSQRAPAQSPLRSGRQAEEPLPSGSMGWAFVLAGFGLAGALLRRRFGES